MACVLGPTLDLVPQIPATGCPGKSFEYRGFTCCIEDGCCWNRCVKADPMDAGDWLKGTGAEWRRNSAKGFWMAQTGNVERKLYTSTRLGMNFLFHISTIT